MSKPEEVLAKAVADLEVVATMAKSRVSAYTRKDGVVVREHDSGRVAKPAIGGSFPRIQSKTHGDWGDADNAHAANRVDAEEKGFKQSGYKKVGAGGHEFTYEHADGRKRVIRVSKKGGKWSTDVEHHEPTNSARVAKPLHHSDLKEGDELIGPDGKKHEYLQTHRGLGRMMIETRAGYKHPTDKNGNLPGWKKTGKNNA